MTPKHKAIFATLPVAKRQAALAYYEALDKYDAEVSELHRMQVQVNNAWSAVRKAQSVVESGFSTNRTVQGQLYIDIKTGFYYEGTNRMYRAKRLNADGSDSKRKGSEAAWPRGPLVELDPDDPFREKRKQAIIVQRLEGKP